MPPLEQVRGSLPAEESAQFLRIVSLGTLINRPDGIHQWLSGEEQQILPHQILIAAWGDFAKHRAEHALRLFVGSLANPASAGRNVGQAFGAIEPWPALPEQSSQVSHSVIHTHNESGPKAGLIRATVRVSRKSRLAVGPRAQTFLPCDGAYFFARPARSASQAP